MGGYSKWLKAKNHSTWLAKSVSLIC